jgi:hypothetical protein
MSKKELIEIPSKGVWSAMKRVKNGDIRHLKITAGEDRMIIDSPISFNLRFIPRVFTAPLQAIGMVASIFTRMTNTKISLHVNKDHD